MGENKRILLKNGLIVDGTGCKGWTGSVLIDEGKIKEVSAGEITTNAKVVDCTGKIISPGFIDSHSHNDWFLPLEDSDIFTDTFIAQGITTSIGGNCGFSAAGIRKNTAYMDKILENPFKCAGIEMNWSSMKEYFGILQKTGIQMNFSSLVGHGTARTSIRGYDSAPIRPDEMRELMKLLESGMEDGAKGVSIGLQYEPGIFSDMNELREVAKLVKKKNKVLTSHSRASSALSGSYPINPFGKPHNILALKEMISIAKETDVRLQFSHLIFVGERTWQNFDETINLVDNAIAEGVDIKFDIFAYNCGASVISVVLPAWFMAKVPAAYENKADLTRLRLELTAIKKILGFGYEDIQIAYIEHPDLKAFNGRFITDIAGELNLSVFETFILFVKNSNGKARVIQHKYSNQQILEALMKHPASIFMTDAWIERDGLQNPASFGCFPKFLQLANEKEIISLETAVHKMTGAAAERFGLKDRGILKKNNAADITVFEWDTVRDNTSLAKTNASPNGISDVFVNGGWVLKEGEIFERQRTGMIIK